MMMKLDSMLPLVSLRVCPAKCNQVPHDVQIRRSVVASVRWFSFCVIRFD